MRSARFLRRRLPVFGSGRTGSPTKGPANQPPHHVAASFAIGLFVATLPTPGLDTVTLVAIGWRFDWANRWALGLSLAILNPVVKGVVYVSSFALGSVLLGPSPESIGWQPSLAAGPTMLSRLVLGNTIIAIAVAIAGYAIAHRWAVSNTPALGEVWSQGCRVVRHSLERCPRLDVCRWRLAQAIDRIDMLTPW